MKRRIWNLQAPPCVLAEKAATNILQQKQKILKSWKAQKATVLKITEKKKKDKYEDKDDDQDKKKDRGGKYKAKKKFVCIWWEEGEGQRGEQYEVECNQSI